MNKSIMITGLMISSVLCGCSNQTIDDPSAQGTRPLVSKDVVFEEVDGVVAVEAEHFFKQEKTDIRAWYLTTNVHESNVMPDADEPHWEGASGGAYLEILPDTRQTPSDELKFEENFTEQPGTMAVLHYRVYFNTPGRYYVWARIYSTGPDDNGLHAGINGNWLSTGKRMQWIAKRRWAWGSKQRTAEVHTGVPHLIYFDIDEPGEHVISFSMREDGAEFDKWMMINKKIDIVEGVGPEPRIKGGRLPDSFNVK